MLVKRTIKIVIGYFWISVISLSAELKAHEMWIEPIRFSSKPNGKIFAHEKVGQNFKGNSYSYLATSFKQLNISQGNKTKPINSRLGDKPFIQESVKDEGLVILSAVSKGTKLIYKTAEQFQKFIKSEKLDWVFEEHKRRGLPDKGFTEIFRRYAKSLVKVGHGKGRIRL